MKDRSIRRHHARRVVKKRLRIAETRLGGAAPFDKKPGRLRKYNLSCGCQMCKLCRKQGVPEKHRAKILSDFERKLASNQVDLEPEFGKILDEEFWNLM